MTARILHRLNILTVIHFLLKITEFLWQLKLLSIQLKKNITIPWTTHHGQTTEILQEICSFEAQLLPFIWNQKGKIIAVHYISPQDFQLFESNSSLLISKLL